MDDALETRGIKDLDVEIRLLFPPLLTATRLETIKFGISALNPNTV